MSAGRRIAVGGFQHETNTFAPLPARYEDFAAGGGWPPLSRGEALLPAVAGINLPVAGFAEQATALGHKLLPLTWAATEPSAHVTEDAFERIMGMMLDDLRAHGDLDAVYLDLHGAMVTEHLQDGEGEIERRVRDVIGPDKPLVVSLDLHANVTPEMVDLADALIAYRTYPHIDMAATGARAARHLNRLLAGADGRHAGFRQLPFLIPITAGCTLHEPAKGLYEILERLEREEEGLVSLSFACGFGPADIWHCGASAIAYGRTPEAAERAAERLYTEACERESKFVSDLLSPEAAVREAIALAANARRPIVLGDTQDNPGAGAESDTTGLLAELVRQDAQQAVLAIVKDPEVAAAAHAAGVGTEITVDLGAKSGQAGHQPYRAQYRVEALGDGHFTATGPFYAGARMELGPMALLALGGVRIIVATRKLQAADQEIFRHLGIEPAEQKILALKSSAHFRADFQPIAETVLMVAAPGPNPDDYRAFSYNNLRPGVRLQPRTDLASPDGT